MLWEISYNCVALDQPAVGAIPQRRGYDDDDEEDNIMCQEFFSEMESSDEEFANEEFDGETESSNDNLTLDISTFTKSAATFTPGKLKFSVS